MRATLVRYNPGGATLLLTPSWIERRLGTQEILVHVLETPSSWDARLVIAPDGSPRPTHAMHRDTTHRYAALVNGVFGALRSGSGNSVLRVLRRWKERLASWRAPVSGWRRVLMPAPAAQLAERGHSADDHARPR